MRRPTTIVLSLALLVGAGLVTEARAEQDGPGREALDSLHRYLLVDCEVGDGEPAMTGVLLHAEALEPELARLLIEGPDDALRAEFVEALGRRWERHAARVESAPLLELDDATREAVMAETREDFIQRGLRDLTLTTREKAVTALAGLGTRTAQRRLRQALSAVPDGEVREMILGALQGQRLLERQQPAAQRTPVHRDAARPGDVN